MAKKFQLVALTISYFYYIHLKQIRYIIYKNKLHTYTKTIQNINFLKKNINITYIYTTTSTIVTFSFNKKRNFRAHFDVKTIKNIDHFCVELES